MNRALFDAVVRYFTDPSIELQAVENREKIVGTLKELCSENSNFKRSIEQTTKTPLAVKTRLEVWGRSLASILGLRFDTERFRVQP